MDYIYLSHQPSVVSRQLTLADVKELLKDWIKLYPNSFAPDVEFKIYQLEDGDIIIQLHEDMSSLAVALLLLYLETTSLKDTFDVSVQSSCKDASNATTQQRLKDTFDVSVQSSCKDASNATTQQRQKDTFDVSVQPSCKDASNASTQQLTAFVTIDDTEVLLKQNLGKRAMVYCESPSKDALNASTQHSSVRFLLDDNYVLDYDFERKPQPVKDSGLQFEESEFMLPENCEIVRVGDVVKKKIDEILEPDVLTPKKMIWYLICGAVGLAIGFFIVYLTGL